MMRRKDLVAVTYTNQEKYIFISYSHKDSSKVLPIIQTLDKHGFRVWYDAGIEAGTEWPEYIEEHLMNASVVLIFMTPNTIESKNCRNEINFALELNKEVLVAYLENTPLLKGMRLQLNSTQSLFRTNHPSDETFVRELINARILQSCRKTATSVNRTIAPQPAATTAESPTRVANVCSIGTNDENDLWPVGTYSRVINRDVHRVVFFHMNLLKPFTFSGTINALYRVYNSANQLIFEHTTTLPIQAGYDRISQGWIIRGKDGSFIPSGEYRFVCSINNSPAFSYDFTICENDHPTYGSTSEPSFLNKLKKSFNL